jgi:hypothetical protein
MVDMFAQTIIATSKSEYATYNHNQRKIVRDSDDNIYVVFLDWESGSYVIKGVKFDSGTSTWNDPFIITEGGGPTLAISDGDEAGIHLVFHSIESLKKIKYIFSNDFSNWSDEIILNEENQICDSPVADIDSAGILNVFWRRANPDTTASLIYAKLSDGIIVERKLICTKDMISGYAIANSLQYKTNDLFFGIAFNEDSVEFFHSGDGMQTMESVYTAKGSAPGITYNSYHINNDYCLARLLYVDTESYLMEVEIDADGNMLAEGQVPVGMIEYYCVDDIAPPIGYSFVFLSPWPSMLYHAFSYGVGWEWFSIIDTVCVNLNPSYPSVAYKHFNFDFVDYIWLDGYGGAENDIFYKRDEKQYWLDIGEDPEKGKGFSITAGPNPFSDKITINILVENRNEVPSLLIYDAKSRLVKQFEFHSINPDGYTISWDGTNDSGSLVEPGMHIVLVSVGNKRTARKILYQPQND